MDVHMYVHMYMENQLSTCLSSKGLGEEGSHDEQEKGHKNFYQECSFWSHFRKRETSPSCLKCCNPPRSQLVKLSIKSLLHTLKLLQLSVVLNKDRLNTHPMQRVRGFVLLHY